MTAITLNLLVEEQLAQEAEARDPFKVALAIGVGLCALATIIGTCLGQFASRAKAQADGLQAKLDSLAKSALDGGTDTKSIRTLADDILAMNHARRLYAQQLALVKDLVPDSIQLERIAFSISAETPPPAPSDASPDGKETAKAKRARASRSVEIERLTLQLDGKAISSRPEIEVDQFIHAMSANEAFNDKVGEIKLRSIARNAQSAEKHSADTPLASFVIQCQYKDRK